MNFAAEVQELMGYLGDPDPDAGAAIPGEGTHVPIWILGSSHGGAQVAAALGLPYSFASHFAPAALMSALEVYRRGFQPRRHRRPRRPAHHGRRQRHGRRHDGRGRAALHEGARAVPRHRHREAGRLPPSRG